MKLTIDLDAIWADGDWGTTVGEIVRDEIRIVVKREVKKAVKDDPDLKRAIRQLTTRAAQTIAEAL